MELLKLNATAKELPMKVLFSVDAILKSFEQYANKEDHPFQKSSKIVLKRLEKFPELRTGIEDLSQLDQYEKELDIILEPLFPEPLQLNEIKAVVLPFKYIAFRPTKRFSNILKNAGEDFQIELSGYNIDKVFFYACSFILATYYQQPVNLNRPIYMEVPNKITGRMYHYRVLFNADFMEVIKTDKAPDLTQEDIDELLRNGEDLELWKSKFPPNSYIFKGFGLMNLFDTTQDAIISKTRSLFLHKKDNNSFSRFEQHLRALFGIKDLMIGYSVYNTKTHHSLGSVFGKGRNFQSLFMKKNEAVNYKKIFCEGVTSCAMQRSEIFALPDVELYGKLSGKNDFYRRLHKKGIKSILLVPIKIDENYLQLLEVGSIRKNELNLFNAAILDDIIPAIKMASERYHEESQNILESTIQENYTSIHPSVKWRFLEAVTVFNTQKMEGIECPILEDIVFEEVYPLYGQSDIKGSSNARNEAIKEDLTFQLSLVINCLEKSYGYSTFAHL